MSTDLPEVRACANDRDCFVANDRAGFVAALERALEADTPAERRRRSAEMARESWTAKVAEIGNLVMSVKQRRGHAATLSSAPQM